MLVLSRKTQETVVIGGVNGFEGVLKVTVLEITSNRIRLGFEGPANVPIHRLELWNQLHACPPVPKNAADNLSGESAAVQ